MIYLDNEQDTRRSVLQDFRPTFGYTVGQAARATFEDNPSTMLLRYGQTFGGEDRKLDANELDTMIKESGVQSFTLPADRYNREAAAILIERARQKQIAADIDSRTEYSWSETPFRFLTRAAITLVDPLNIAALFIPPFGTEYFAARAAAAGGVRSLGLRAAEGAYQGVLGMAALEVPGYALHRGLHDDYTMVDTLANLAMGAGLGAALHGAFGARRIPVQAVEENRAAAQIAVAQVLQGQPVAVDHVYAPVASALIRRRGIQEVYDAVEDSIKRHDVERAHAAVDAEKQRQLDQLAEQSRVPREEYNAATTAKAEPERRPLTQMEEAFMRAGLLRETPTDRAWVESARIRNEPVEPVGRGPSGDDALLPLARRVIEQTGEMSIDAVERGLGIDLHRASRLVARIQREADEAAGGMTAFERASADARAAAEADMIAERMRQEAMATLRPEDVLAHRETARTQAETARTRPTLVEETPPQPREEDALPPAPEDSEAMAQSQQQATAAQARLAEVVDTLEKAGYDTGRIKAEIESAEREVERASAIAKAYKAAASCMVHTDG